MNPYRSKLVIRFAEFKLCISRFIKALDLDIGANLARDCHLVRSRQPSQQLNGYLPYLDRVAYRQGLASRVHRDIHLSSAFRAAAANMLRLLSEVASRDALGLLAGVGATLFASRPKSKRRIARLYISRDVVIRICSTGACASTFRLCRLRYRSAIDIGV
jgi:hypothetical protein